MRRNELQPTFQQIMDKVARDKKVFFCSDFHLATDTLKTEKDREREKNVVNWLTSIEEAAGAIIMLGDIFDVWFEYKYLIPKGFSHFFFKIYELRKKNIQVVFFTGNHDYFMYNYFFDTYGIPVFKTLQSFILFEKKITIGHGDAIGPKDYVYKMAKKIWETHFFQTLIEWFPSQIAMCLVQSFLKNRKKNPVTLPFNYEKEWIIQWIKQSHAKVPQDIYIFGHRHLPIHLDDKDGFKYINLGEWITLCTYAEIGKNGLRYMHWDMKKQCSQPFQAYPLVPQPLKSTDKN